MSYNFAVVKAGGQLTVESSSGGADVPDGRFTIYGHEDDLFKTITVCRVDGGMSSTGITAAATVFR